MSYIVQAPGMVAFPQRNSPTHDGNPDENQNANCGESCVCSVLRYYGIRRPYPLYDYYEPDDVKDFLDSQNTVGALTYSNQIQNALAHFGGIPSITVVPQGKRNGVNGLLDLEWQSLVKGIPVIESAAWIDDAGVIHHEIPHWIVVDYQTEQRVRSLDSWPLPSGGIRDESYDLHYARSQQVMVIPTIGPKG